MSDHVNALLVVLEQDMRDDDVEPLRAAIAQLRGVSRVDLNVVTPADHIAFSRARGEVAKALYAVIDGRRP